MLVSVAVCIAVSACGMGSGSVSVEAEEQRTGTHCLTPAQAESALRFPRDDKKQETIWPAFDLPTTRQGIDTIIVK